MLSAMKRWMRKLAQRIRPQLSREVPGTSVGGGGKDIKPDDKDKCEKLTKALQPSPPTECGIATDYNLRRWGRVEATGTLPVACRCLVLLEE